MESEGYSYSRPWEGARDLVGAASGWGRSDCCCNGHFSPSYFQDGTLYAVLAAGALAFYVLYSTITMEMGAGGADQPANGFFRVKRNSAYKFTSDNYLDDWVLGGSVPCLAHCYLDHI